MCKLSLLLIIGLAGCMRPKEADIVGAAVIAEVAQTQNARPSEIVVDKVTFLNEQHASVAVTHRLLDSRLPHSVPFACEASRKEDRWSVKCTER